MGWCCGCKWPLLVHDEEELLALRGTPGAVNAQGPGGRLAHGWGGQLLGERGDSARALPQARWAQGLALLPLLRRTMQPRLRRWWARRRRRQSGLIEPRNAQRQTVAPMEQARPRSLRGCMVNLGGGLIAHTCQPKTLSLGWGRGESGLPVVV